jgi:hypothetical protein
VKKTPSTEAGLPLGKRECPAEVRFDAPGASQPHNEEAPRGASKYEGALRARILNRTFLERMFSHYDAPRRKKPLEGCEGLLEDHVDWGHDYGLRLETLWRDDRFRYADETPRTLTS